MIRSTLLLLLIFTFCDYAYAQKIDHLASYSAIQSANYFRFNYDNDLFAGTDQNYSQGFSFALVAPFLNANPLNHLLCKPKDFESRHGIALEHIVYTPANFQLSEIQIGDRPFAAAIYLKSFSIAKNPAKAQRLTSAISIGIMGPAAFGNEMQTRIHEITESQKPLGWNNQIENDLVLNYEMNYEKQLIRINDLFALQAQTSVAIGTLFTNATFGINFSFGIINSPFKTNADTRNFRLYAYANPAVNAIGYDATLQGGLLEDKSPYTIAAKDLERITGQINYGIVMQLKKVYLEYSRSVITREFTTGSSAKWGGVKVGIGF